MMQMQQVHQSSPNATPTTTTVTTVLTTVWICFYDALRNAVPTSSQPFPSKLDLELWGHPPLQWSWGRRWAQHVCQQSSWILDDFDIFWLKYVEMIAFSCEYEGNSMWSSIIGLCLLCWLACWGVCIEWWGAFSWRSPSPLVWQPGRNVCGMESQVGESDCTWKTLKSCVEATLDMEKPRPFRLNCWRVAP